MSRAEKLLGQMRSNPRGDWTIEDIIRVCRYFNHLGLECKSPKRGSHYKVVCPQVVDILTIPAGRPIKPVYVKAFLSIIDSITDNEEGGE